LPCLRHPRFQYLGVDSVRYSFFFLLHIRHTLYLDRILFCPFSLLSFFHYSALTLFLRRVLVVNIKLRDAPVDGELDPIVGDNRALASGRMRSFRDSDDGAGLDAMDDEESAHIAPIRSGSNGARRMARGGNRDYDDGL
jgi:hypothetical protein